MHAQSEFQDAYGSKKTATQVNQIYQNLFSRDADADGLEYWTGQIANGSLQLAEIAVHLIWAAKNNDGGSADKTALENKVAAATAFTADVAADATAQLAYTADDADAFSTAKTFISGVTTTAATDAEIDTQITTITTAYTANEAKGVTYTFTTATDTFTGGAKNDTFSGVIDSDTATENTFNPGDEIDGGAGTDTLKLTYGIDSGANAALPAATISNIENFEIKNSDDDLATIDFATITGEKSVNIDKSVGAVTVNNLVAGTTAVITGNGSLQNGASTFDYVDGTTVSETQNLDLKGGTAGSTPGAVTITGAGIKTHEISSTGAANEIGALGLAASATSFTIDATTKIKTAAITSDAAKSVTIKGAGAVDIDAAALGATINTVDGATSTGDIDLSMGNLGADVTNADAAFDQVDVTVKTGSGNDEISVANVVSDRELLVETGAGDDTVTIGSALINATSALAGDVINAGEGTDTLISTTAYLGSHVKTTGVSNFEKIKVTNEHTSSIDVGDFGTGITTVSLAAGANGGTVIFNAGASTLEIADINDGAITITDTGTGTTDSATIKLTDTTSTDVINDQTVTATGIETLTIDTTLSKATTTTTAQTIGDIAITADTGGTTKLVLTGAAKLTTDAVSAQNVDASGMTGILDMTAHALDGVTGKVNTIDGGSGNDILKGDSNDTTNMTGGAGNDNITGGSDTAGETISGGAGNDVISGGGGKDTLNGDAGKDTITVGSATASVDGGEGNDTVLMESNLTFGTTIVGGAGTDTLDIETAAVASAGSVVSGFEVLDLDYAGVADLDNFANNTFTTVSLGAFDYGDIDSIRNETIEIDAVLAGDTAFVLEDATGTSDSISLELSGNAAVNQAAVITIAGVETINILTTDDNDTGYELKTLDTLVAAAADKIVITGDSSITLSGSTTATLNEIDASGMTIANTDKDSSEAGLTYATGSSGNTTVGDNLKITGSNGADVLTGHANVDDTFLGGGGADTLTYKGRKGTFTGGGGNDEFHVDVVQDDITTNFLTITDVTDGDTLDYAALINGTDTWTTTKTTLGSGATLTNYLDAVCATNGATNSTAGWFNYGGNTYIAVNATNATVFTVATDLMVKLTGTLDLKDSDLTATGLTFDF